MVHQLFLLQRRMGKEQVHLTTQQVYAFICERFDEHGFGPSIRQIAEACFMHHTTVLRYLDEGWS